MKKREFIAHLEELMEAEPGTFRESDRLTDVGWDSLRVLGFQTLLDAELGTRLPVRQIIACETVGDLVRSLGDKLTD